MHVTDAEKDIMAPALRRACALALHWEGGPDMQGVSCVLAEIRTAEAAKDVILSLLMINGEPSARLRVFAECAAARERL
jgi:hypothetical protein